MSADGVGDFSPYGASQPKIAQPFPPPVMPMFESHRCHFARAQLVNLTSAPSINPKIPFSCAQLVNMTSAPSITPKIPLCAYTTSALDARRKKTHMRSTSGHCAHHIEMYRKSGLRVCSLVDVAQFYMTRTFVYLAELFSSHMRSAIRHCAHHIEIP